MRVLLVIALFLIYWLVSMPWFCNIRENCANLAANKNAVVAPVDTAAPAPNDSLMLLQAQARAQATADSLAAANGKAQIIETDNKIIIRFPTGSSANYTDAALESTLKKAAARIQAGSQAKVSGHSDNVGALDANIRLSQKRADAIKAKLIANGASPTNISSTGNGPNQPVADNNTQTGRQQNRRVEINFN